MDKDSPQAPTRLTDHSDAQELKQSAGKQPTETTQSSSPLNALVPTNNFALSAPVWIQFNKPMLNHTENVI